MSQYQDLSGRKHFDFGYSKTGTYRRSVPSDGTIIFRKKAKPQPRYGKVCPACGLTRSITNLCDCNS